MRYQQQKVVQFSSNAEIDFNKKFAIGYDLSLPVDDDNLQDNRIHA